MSSELRVWGTSFALMATCSQSFSAARTSGGSYSCFGCQNTLYLLITCCFSSAHPRWSTDSWAFTGASWEGWVASVWEQHVVYPFTLASSSTSGTVISIVAEHLHSMSRVVSASPRTPPLTAVIRSLSSTLSREAHFGYFWFRFDTSWYWRWSLTLTWTSLYCLGSVHWLYFAISPFADSSRPLASALVPTSLSNTLV